MTFHGACESFDDLETHHTESQRRNADYRNLVGAEGHRDLYQGLGNSSDNLRMFQWLARCMGTAYPWKDGDNENRRIPAGYTYLAQLVAHDVVQSTEPLDARDGRHPWRRNMRSGRLMLDTIYGGGPETDPLAYAIERHKDRGGKFEWSDRVRLRLGKSAGDAATDSRDATAGAPRDLPRVSCPYHDDLDAAFTERPGNPDVLIPDSRNDDNLILSQLTVIFHLFHNAIYSTLEGNPAQLSGNQKLKARQRARLFKDARRLVTLVYRKVVFRDLLSRLLHPIIYEKYESGELSPFVRDPDDSRIPLEFSHAAYRVGHAMVRDSYDLNSGTTAGLSKLLRLTSSADAGKFPLKSDWLINWSLFFSLSEDSTPNFSRRLAPSVASKFVGGPSFGMFEIANGAAAAGNGLMLRDLMRGATAGIQSVASLLRAIPEDLRNQSPLVKDGKIAEGPIRAWLDSAQSHPLFIPGPESASFEDCISRDPPLMLFILLEAAETTFTSRENDQEDIDQGQCLGIIGSTIVAEFLFLERYRTRHLIEEDNITKKHAEKIFGTDVPCTMPDLLRFIAQFYKWEDPKFEFIAQK